MKSFLSLCSMGLLILTQCTFESPSAPTWDMGFVIPLVDKAYTMEDLADETDHLTVNAGDNGVDFNFRDNFSVAVAQALQIEVRGRETRYAFNRITPDSTGISGGIEIVGAAVLDTAWLDLSIDNRDNDCAAYVTLTTTDLYDPVSMQPYAFFLEAAPNAFVTHSFLIEDAPFMPPSHQNHSYMRYTVEPVGCSDDDAVYVDFELHDMIFTTLPGIFDEVEVSFNDINFELPIPEEVEGFRIGDGWLTILFTEQPGIPLEFQFEIAGADFRQGNAENILIEDRLSGTAAESYGDSLQIGGADIVNFINSQPESIVISGRLKVGDGSFATIQQEDSLKGDFIFEMPLIFALESRKNYSEIETLSIDEEAAEAVEDNLLEISVESTLINHLPVGASVSLCFSESISDSTLYDKPDLIIGPLGLAPAVLSENEPAVVIEPGQSTYVQQLTQSRDIDVFENETLYMGIEYEFSGTQGQLAKVRPSDYIRVSALVKALIHAETPDDDEGGE